MLNLKTFLLSSILTANLLATANDGIYVEAGVGIGTKDKVNTKNADYFYERGFLGSLALGYQIDCYRVEIENRYKKDTIVSQGNIATKGDFRQNTQMINAYYSGYNSSRLVSSIKLGIGISSITLDEQNLEDSGVFTYQGIFSVGYMHTKNIITTLKYNYVRTISSDNFDKNSDHLISLNLRYLF